MKKLLLAIALTILATPAFAKDYIVKEISDPANSGKPYYFAPDYLAIQTGDTVTFVDAQEDTHDVMFDIVPKAMKEGTIMSPMLEKEGAKWSYTFTVPGSYHFHCHPHEALDMQGTLIVGKASKPGETRHIDHEEMEHHMGGMNMKNMDTGGHPASTALPQATGKINSIDTEEHTINVSHNPIVALSWPAMTMDFSVAKNVDLSAFRAKESVSFTLKKDKGGQYIINTLKKD